MAGNSADKFQGGLLGWVDARFPLSQLWNDHLARYYTPRNFNFWYYFGSLALLVLVLQIVTGIFLTMFYKPDATLAFASVEYIMRDVEWGWLIRYMHSTGASFFFIVVYLHMFRALLYGSYKKPRELIWIFGVLIYIVLMAEAFMGYLLPWGQMSYWGAQVIVNLFATIPYIGPDLVTWIRGDFLISDATLNRFFALHVIALPLVLLLLVVAHIIALHEVGSNNPDGVEIKQNKDANGVPLDGIPFHPYYTVKDLVGVGVFFIAFFAVVFFAPGNGRLFPRARQLRTRRFPRHAGAHRAGMVFHLLLHGPASGAGSLHRCHGHGRRRRHPVLRALAGPQSGEVRALPVDRAPHQPDRLRHHLHDPGLPRGPAGECALR
jgi:ubiquinol-cytochrome c reductase cytochrome b subunit